MVLACRKSQAKTIYEEQWEGVVLINLWSL